MIGKDEIYLTSRLCKMMDVSLNKSLFAGTLLEWVSEIGSISAMRFAKTKNHMALYRIDNLRITKPIKYGRMIDFYATELVYGNSSVSFKMNGYFNSDEEQFLTLECTYVQLDENGNKLIIKEKNNEKNII